MLLDVMAASLGTQRHQGPHLCLLSACMCIQRQWLCRWSRSPQLQSRIRFLVRDVADLRRSKWVPRRETLKVCLLTPRPCHQPWTASQLPHGSWAKALAAGLPSSKSPSWMEGPALTCCMSHTLIRLSALTVQACAGKEDRRGPR